MNSKYVCHSQSGSNLFFLLSLRNRPNFFLCFCWFVGLLLCWFVITNEKTWICLVLRFYEEIFFLNQIVLESQLNSIFYSICFCIPIFLIPPPLSYILFIFLTAGLLRRAYPYEYFYCKNGFYVLYDRFIGLINSYNVYL